MKIVIHGRSFREEATPYIEKLFETLEKEDIQVQVSEIFARFLQERDFSYIPKNVYIDKSEVQDADFLLSLGGDGTLLESVTHIGSAEIPILGINTGRLGFLATTSTNEIENAIKSLFEGYYSIDKRTLVHVDSNKDLFGDIPFGLNEFTITKRDTSSMIVVHTFIDGEYLNSYWADGIIVSTPTGSTGYSLSVGGPVVLPQSNNFIIAPISPHNLNVRPLIISDNSKISFGIEGRSKSYLTSLDSRSEVIDNSIEIAVCKEKFKAHLVKIQDDNFLTTLRKKLSWGLDVRN